MSTSSTSFEASPNAARHSSAKGPDDVSFGMVPTFFYNRISMPHSQRVCFVYPSAFDDVQAFLELLGVFCCVLSTDQDLDGKLSTFQGFQVFC